MKIVFLFSAAFIALIVLSRLSLVAGGGLFDLILFSLPAFSLFVYIYAVLSENKAWGRVGALFLSFSAILFFIYSLIDPLGSLIYSFIYCFFIVLVFFPAIFISYNCSRGYISRDSS